MHLVEVAAGRPMECWLAILPLGHVNPQIAIGIYQQPVTESIYFK
jgi:hypothetical protein